MIIFLYYVYKNNKCLRGLKGTNVKLYGKMVFVTAADVTYSCCVIIFVTFCHIACAVSSH